MAAEHLKAAFRPERSKATSVAFALAAIPALFLPFSYLFLFVWVVVNIAPHIISGNYPETPNNSIFPVIVGAGYYGTLIQWPFYFLWAALSSELNWRSRLLWIVVLFFLNMFAIPYFLYCKYRGTTKSVITDSIKIEWLRRYFDENAPARPEEMIQAEYKRSNIRMLRSLVVVTVLLFASAYWNAHLLIDNFYLRNTRDNWARLGGTNFAYKSFSKGEIYFYQTDATHKANAVINTRDGYPVKAWPQSDPESDAAFVDNFNKTMIQLIGSSKGAP